MNEISQLNFGFKRPKTFSCPHCGTVIEQTDSNTQIHQVEFSLSDPAAKSRVRIINCALKVVYRYCPLCEKYAVRISNDNHYSGIPPFSFSQPPVTGFNVPEYIPDSIKSDYYEANAIVDLSPKASATLARRCLQGMIRDFWGITEKTLFKEIEALESKIPADQWSVINGLRRLGNIGAHMESDVNTIVDIDTDEARKLLKLIELLFKDWYVQRHEREVLYNEIIAADQEKQAQRQRHE